MPKTKKKKGFKNQCFNAWHTDPNRIRLQISWWMWLAFAVLPTLLKLLKKLSSKSYQKSLNTETLPEFA